MRMKKGRVILLVSAAAAAVVTAAVLIFGDRGFLDVYRLHRLDRARTAEIAAARAEIDSLHSEIERLKSDTSYIVKIARERHGMALPGEKVIKIVDKRE